MRAVAVNEFGGDPKVVDVAKPTPGRDELLVEVAAAAVNPFDWKVADGMLAGSMEHTFPLVLGMDFAGTVVDRGADATRFSVGDRVFGSVLRAPVGAVGAYAEFLTVPAAGLVASAADLDPAQAAALPTAAGTALGLLEAGGIRAGQTILVIGAAGGVGTFLTQLAAARDVRVLAVTRGVGAAGMAALGAAQTYDATGGIVADKVRSDHPDGVDALVDLVSDAADFAAYARLIRDGGVALSTQFVADPQELAARGVEAINHNQRSTAQLYEQLADELRAHRIAVPIEARLPLTDAAGAIARSRLGGARGKTVILP
ncbi:NADP-dependent oxidoreductase [Embleya scabrispora]|uniref:NADP-dependent oxidoreductase n=1 Tax=Embleya scabrispora TaxID=159449 RepID=UPI00039A4CFF|nr:NADP-dependent oxidoreductase [Embleya scabrispora]MYS82172.1 zinc-binding dehydrogenase [Streptomyces sp. SID5474]